MDLTSQISQPRIQRRPYQGSRRLLPGNSGIAFAHVPKGRIPLLLRLSFLLFVFAIPLESLNVSLDLGPVSVARLAGLGLFAVSILYFKRCYSVLPSSMWWFVAYLVVFVLVGLTAEPIYRSALVTPVFSFVQLLAFFAIASNLLQDDTFSRKVMRTYAFSTVLLTLAFALGLPGFSDSFMRGGRVSTLGANPNYLALVLALAAVTLLGLAVEKRFRAGFLVASMVPLLVMLVQTGSRASIVGLIAGSLCYLLGSGLSRKVVAAIFMVSALLCVGYMIMSDTEMVDRWLATAEGDSAGRDEILVHTLGMISERPLFGWGPVEFQTELRIRFSGQDTGQGQDSHNMILDLVLEVGILGAIPFLVGMALCGRAAWRARHGRLGILPLATLTTLFVALQFHGWAGSKPMWLVLALCAGAGQLAALQPSRRRNGLQLPNRFAHPFSAVRPLKAIGESQK